MDGVLYGFFMKADTKGTIWYSPKVFAANGWEPLTADSSFDDLITLTEQIKASGLTPWSIGVESGGASGWPGTDWIQEIILGEAGGGEVNDGLIDGSIPFTDPRVKSVWEKFGQIALTDGYTAQGGAEGINATGFVDATFPPFEDPPRAALYYLGGFAAGFISDQFPDAVSGEDFDIFPFPGGGIAGGANIVYAFNDDETTCSLMQHLASASAQQIWVNLGGVQLRPRADRSRALPGRSFASACSAADGGQGLPLRPRRHHRWRAPAGVLGGGDQVPRQARRSGRHPRQASRRRAERSSPERGAGGRRRSAAAPPA